ncbi:D-alanine--D-alanine ligase [Paenibacillus tarimensis]|uniref:D-alanine--D-alanine ligase n=1 Tax=Paenibacillus tarimensis TaxID=416012 RepID=UPI001F412782|nr:D-alanine--D-alanine ligase [Paenibacillus tarimensis]MCF2945995.1 D-alanine--D-alanine ligase [Paenibacillus tarimensis]
MGEKIKVGLLYGGKSGEHEVSLQTALAVMKAFDYTKYEIKPFYITKQGEWRSGAPLLQAPEEVAQLRFGESGTDNALVPLFTGLTEKAGNDRTAVSGVDVMFPLLHGTFGEDGTVQGLLEMANLPYVGAGVLASAVGMDKIMMKKVFAQEGIPQCAYRYFNRTQWQKDPHFFVMEVEVSLGYPCFIKPANLGSSVGISKAKNREELLKAIDYAFRFDRKVIVEEFVDAREIEVSVLGNDEPRASVPGEVVSSGDFYDYNAKYIDGKSVMQIPAQLPDETAEAVREMAVRAFLAIDGSGLSRVDFFMRKEDGKLLINEVNTMPGFTPFSMYPLMWKETGLSYQELLDKLIQLALERHAEKQQIDYTGGTE